MVKKHEKTKIPEALPSTKYPKVAHTHSATHGLILPYVPRPLQWDFHEQRTRFCVLLCHRRFGKTVAAINDLIRQALRVGGADWRAAYMAPFLGQAKTVAWDYLKYFAGAVPGTRFLETELRCILPTGASIRLFGTDNAHALRGMYLDDLVLDEPADMPRQVWTSVLRPMLADRKGRALFCGTPQGLDNLLHDVWEEAGRAITQGANKDVENKKIMVHATPEKSGTHKHSQEHAQWSRFCFRASETGYLDAAELKAARDSMPKEEYLQEFECSFAAAVRGAFYAQTIERLEQEGRITCVPYAPELPVHTAWDLGIDDATGIWFFQVQSGGQWRILEYFEDSGQGLEHYIRVLQEKNYVYGCHMAPHDIRVRELGTGLSRLEMAQQLGVNFRIAPSLPLADGINALRVALPRMWFDTVKCAAGLRALKQYRRQWRPRQEVYSSAPLHDWSSHAADALRYAVTGFRPQTKDAEKRARTSYNIWR